jgi:hypothetical protein
MIELKSGLKSVTDREQWASRGASFVAKVEATKAVWFPPKPEETGRQAASTAKKTAKKATKKSTAAARKSTNRTRNVTNPVRRKKA